MEFWWLLKGVLIGFIVAAPVGPVGIYCAERTVQEGRFRGYISGIGAAIADFVAASVVIFGLTFISELVSSHLSSYQKVGSIILVLLGIHLILKRKKENSLTAKYSWLGGASDFVSTFILTISNPATFLAFPLFLPIFGFGKESISFYEKLLLLLGVFFGASVLWLVLCEGVLFFRAKTKQLNMDYLSRIGGAVICLFGIFIFFKGECFVT